MTPHVGVAPKRAHPAVVTFFGVLLGFSLSRIGFTNYDELHRMFLFADLRMFVVFCGGVALSAPLFLLLKKRRALPSRALHKGTIAGGVVFGLGWVIAGACPGVAFAQLGEGKLWALATLAGIAAGTLGYRALNRRLLRLDTSSCG
jgi:uncharacterized membrane protein YedE/YeeE